MTLSDYMCQENRVKEYSVDTSIQRLEDIEWDTQTLLRFWDTNGSHNLGQTTRFYNNQQKGDNLWTLLYRRTTKWNWKNVKRGISTWTLLWNWKKLWDMKVTIIPITIGALGAVTKGLVQGLKDLKITGRVETVQIQHCWDQPAYWEDPRDLRRLAISQIQVENYQLMLMWKLSKGNIIINSQRTE